MLMGPFWVCGLLDARFGEEHRSLWSSEGCAPRALAMIAPRPSCVGNIKLSRSGKVYIWPHQGLENELPCSNGIEALSFQRHRGLCLDSFYRVLIVLSHWRVQAATGGCAADGQTAFCRPIVARLHAYGVDSTSRAWPSSACLHCAPGKSWRAFLACISSRKSVLSRSS